MVEKTFFLSRRRWSRKRPESPPVFLFFLGGGSMYNIPKNRDKSVRVVGWYNTKRMRACCHGAPDSRSTSVWTDSFNFNFMAKSHRFVLVISGPAGPCGECELMYDSPPPTPAVRDDWTHCHCHDHRSCRCTARLSQQHSNQLQMETVRVQFKAIDYSRARPQKKWRHLCHLLLFTV